jgi:hypothetical protein
MQKSQQCQPGGLMGGGCLEGKEMGFFSALPPGRPPVLCLERMLHQQDQGLPSIWGAVAASDWMLSASQAEETQRARDNLRPSSGPGMHQAHSQLGQTR